MSHECTTVIESLGTYLPSQQWATEDVVAGCRARLRLPLERYTGIASRHVAGTAEFSIDLACRAVEACLAVSRLDPGDIELLICCNISRYDAPGQITCEPATSIRLRHRFGLATTLTLDLSNACAGMFTGIRVADSLLRTTAIKSALIVSGEYITYLTQSAQKQISHRAHPQIASLTLGDAGAALILLRAAANGAGFHTMELCSLPQHAMLCVARFNDEPEREAVMLSDPVGLTAAGLSALRFVLPALQPERWTSTGIRQFIPHQTSTATINDTVREVNTLFASQVISPHQVLNNLARRGNTASTAHFIAVHDAILQRKIDSGDTVAFGISGSGLTVGGALYTFDDLPDRMRAHAKRTPPDRLPPRPCSRRSPALVVAAGASGVRIESVGLATRDASHRDAPALAVEAAEDCLARSSYELCDIDLLLFSGVYRHDGVFEPAMATLIARKLGIEIDASQPSSRRLLAFDVFNSSLGFLQAMFLALAELEVGNVRRAMILAAETDLAHDVGSPFSRGLEEAGSAVILDRIVEAGTGFGWLAFQSDTEPIDAVSAYLDVGGGLRGSVSPGLERRYLDLTVDLVDDLLAHSEVEKSRVKVVLPPQISRPFVENLGERLMLPEAQVVGVAEAKDLFSSSLPYGLRRAQEEGLTQPGDIGLLLGVGAGIQAGGALYCF